MQEFVAEAIGISRQSRFKVENGSADPSTSNLIALANFYRISADELLKNVVNKSGSSKSAEKIRRRKSDRKRTYGCKKVVDFRCNNNKNNSVGSYGL